MWSGPIARITKNSTNWPTANYAWRRLTSSCESGKILTTVCALTKPWDILLPRNSCSSGNANLKRQSVTNLLDEYTRYAHLPFGLSIDAACSATPRDNVHGSKRRTCSATCQPNLRAVLTPRNLPDVTLRGSSGRVVCRIPVGCPVVDLIEIRTANRDVERSRCQSADGQAVCCRLRCIEVVAACRSTVSRRKNHRDPLRGGLLPQAVVKGVSRTAQVIFTVSIALAHDPSQVVLNDVERRKIDSGRGRRRSRHNKLYCCPGRGCS